MRKIGLRFGGGREEWDIRLQRLSPLLILFTLLPYAVALTQMPRPAEMLPTASIHAAAASLLMVAAVVVAIIPVVLLLRGRATGVSLMVAAMFYLCPALAALAIAVGPMGSGGMTIATLGLVLWCGWRLAQADRRVDTHSISALSRERIDVDNEGPFLLPSSAFENGGQLATLHARQGVNWLILLELAAPISILTMFAGSLPLHGGTVTPAYTGAFPWLLWTIVFVLGRKPLNSQLLLWRALKLRMQAKM